MMALPFIPGYSSQSPRLLERFLPPLEDGIAAHYIQKHTQPGDLVFDAFGQSPSLAVEALSLDRRLLVAGFNPVSRLALSLGVRPPSMAELRSALTLLADAPVGREPGDRLERHVRDLYRTTCAVCEAPANADLFEWDAGADVPVEKYYYCSQCAAARQSPTDDQDRARARRHVRTGLDYYYLLDRVAALGDPDRAPAEEAMAVYPARTLAAVGAVLSKVDALSVDRETRRLLAGLLVAALDQCTVLAQERPKALAVPSRYRETNFWLALERGLGVIAGVPAPDRSLTLAQALGREASSGIYAHPGSVRELAGLVPAGACSLLVSALPRPNQAYWALSAVWSAWLWGRESAEALRAVLRRRRYDWAWHAKALERSLAPLAGSLRFRGRLVTLLAEAEPGFSASVIAAAAGAGYLLDGAALRADTGEAQAEWLAPARSLDKPRAGREAEVRRVSAEAMEACLRQRAEPSRWSSLHFAAWTGLARQHLLVWQVEDPLGTVQAALDELAGGGARLEHFAATSLSEAATGRWYLRQPGDAPAPLADRVEAEVVHLLSGGEPVEEHEVQLAICARFPGDATPGHGLVAACLASYAQRLESGLWQLRPEDAPGPRADEAEAIRAALKALAQHHGFTVDGDNPQVWHRDERAHYYVAILTSAAISPYLLGPHPLAQSRYLVLPGGRAGLVEHKLRRDPRLRRALLDGAWSIVKFRHIRRIVAEAQLTGAALETALAGDPLEAMQQLVLVP